MLRWSDGGYGLSMSEAATPKRRTDEIGDESRRRILGAAGERFAEKGFERTSPADVPARPAIIPGAPPWPPPTVSPARGRPGTRDRKPPGGPGAGLRAIWRGGTMAMRTSRSTFNPAPCSHCRICRWCMEYGKTTPKVSLFSPRRRSASVRQVTASRTPAAQSR